MLLLALLLAASPAPQGARDRVTALARKDLAAHLKVSEEKIKTVSAEPRTWPDGGLGCGQPGMMYPQMVTQGFEIVLQAEGRSFTYHSSQREVVRCEGLVTPLKKMPHRSVRPPKRSVPAKPD